MAVDGFTINGSAFVYVTTGSAGALELLGYTDNGVDIQISYHRKEVYTDLYGEMTPQDFMDMGMVAAITTPFVAVDRTVLAKLMTLGDNSGSGGSGSSRMLNSPGLLLGAGGHSVGVAVASPADVGWYFPECLIKPVVGTVLATKLNPLKVGFVAWPFQTYNATSGKDGVLWQRQSVPT
jgi:hypothetical protein